jgi:hypothetical protein
MQDNLVYAPMLGVVALACIDTAITGKFRPFRNSERNWQIPKAWRWLLAIVGVCAAVLVFLLIFIVR